MDTIHWLHAQGSFITSTGIKQNHFVFSEPWEVLEKDRKKIFKYPPACSRFSTHKPFLFPFDIH